MYTINEMLIMTECAGNRESDAERGMGYYPEEACSNTLQPPSVRIHKTKLKPADCGNDDKSCALTQNYINELVMT